MMRKRLQPDNPVEWLNRAKSSLALAKQCSREIYSEDLCFQAQQAAEKAIKAVYISKKVAFPYIHDISQLLATLEKEGVIIPNDIKTASTLTLYAAQTRYPGLEGPVSDDEYHKALVLAERVVVWAEKNMKPPHKKN
ncbi:MAG: HEPN domain-containing protein [Methanoregula sp.]|nr:HEPN domain-containing protein [Methanoregula sp.]